MAAAGGVGDANSKVNREVFDWWIEHHQPILAQMVQDTPHTFQYYGGFALNILLGRKKGQDSSNLLECYRAGYRDIHIHASDIDAKILGVAHKDEGDTLYSMLEKGRSEHAPKKVVEDAKPIYDTVMQRASEMSQTILCGPEELGESAPFQYLLGHCFKYTIFPRDGVPEDHFQLILTALFKDGGKWKSQVLSELTPTAVSPLASDPIFKYTGFIQLRSQFLAHQTFLQNRLSRLYNPANRTRKQRVNARLEKIMETLHAATAYDPTKKGGARRLRRRRGSVKK